MIDRAHNRAEKWRTQLVQELPMPEETGQTAILGIYSMCLMNSRTRLLLEPTAISIDHCKESPAAVARDYLTVEYKRGPFAKSTQIDAIQADLLNPPNYAEPHVFSHGFYIDIRSAYWAIMRVAGWNVDYYPGRWLLPGKPPVTFPFPEHKVARNCLVSSGLIGDVPMWSKERGYFKVHKGNVFANLQLWRLVQDILNSIAFQAVQAGAIYANTDGFIAPNNTVREKVEAIITDWGLSSRIKAQGSGSVVASGTYCVGPSRSGHLKYRSEPTETPPLKLPRFSSWLQSRFARFSSIQMSDK